VTVRARNDRFILETERLVLRRQRDDDVTFLVDLWTDPEVTRHLGGPRERDRLRTSLEETAADPGAERFDLWPVADKAAGHLIGHCGLLDKEVEGQTEIELVFVLAVSAWGRGYATEIGRALCRYAFEILGITRLIALIELGNDASERTAASIGMRFEREVTRSGGALRKLYAISAPPDSEPDAQLGLGDPSSKRS